VVTEMLFENIVDISYERLTLNIWIWHCLEVEFINMQVFF